MSPATRACIQFQLGGDGFGIPLENVREIVTAASIAAVPLAPPVVKGLANVRGRVVTLIDMGRVYGRTPTPLRRDDDRLAIVLAGFAASFPYLYMLRRRAQRFDRIEEQLPEALEFLARALRAGHPLAVTLELLGNEHEPPLAAELRITSDERNLGLSWEDAMRHLTQRVHTSVGASRTVHRHPRALETRERVLEQPLYGVALGLPLPTNETRPVVSESELEVSQRVHLAQA